MIMPTVKFILRNWIALLNTSEGLGFRVRILRMIRPRRVAYPVFTTTTLLEVLLSKTFEPSNSQVFSFLVDWISWAGNLPMGMLYPVRLASFTNTSPSISMPSNVISSSFWGITTSPGTREWLSTSVSFPFRITLTLYCFSAIYLILRKLIYSKM